MDTIVIVLAPLACNLDWSICIPCLRRFVVAAAQRLFGRAASHAGCKGVGKIPK